MPRITFVQPNGTLQTFEAGADPTPMHVATRFDVPGMPSECGGQLACATCLVEVTPEWADIVGPPGPDEGDMIEDTLQEVPERYRLACQIALGAEMDGLILLVRNRGALV